MTREREEFLGNLITALDFSFEPELKSGQHQSRCGVAFRDDAETPKAGAMKKSTLRILGT